MQNDPILRRGAVQAMVGLSCSTIYAAMARGEFPRPIKLGRRAVGWRQAEIAEWLDRRERSCGWHERNNAKGVWS